MFSIDSYTSSEWLGGKYAGHILSMKDNQGYFGRFGGERTGGAKIQKSFNVKTYETLEKAKEAAEKWLIEHSTATGLLRNKYKIIYKDEKPTYLLVELTQNYCTLMDYEQLPILEKYRLYCTKSSSENSKQYCIFDTKEKLCKIHKHITGFKMTDHINRYPLDNRRENLRETNASENNKNRTCIHSVKTDYNPLDRIYTATIEYILTHKFQKETVSKTFHYKGDAEKWIKMKSEELDKFEDQDYTFKYLRSTFEELMKRFGDNHYWNDQDKDESVIEEKQEEISNTILQMNPKEQRRQIYLKFKEIDPDFVMNEDWLKTKTIEKMKYNKVVYKYCSCCDKWVNVENYYTSNKNYDKLDRNCKSCKSRKSKEINKKWREEHKDDISKYNKEYREKQKNN